MKSKSYISIFQIGIILLIILFMLTSKIYSQMVYSEYAKLPAQPIPGIPILLLPLDKAKNVSLMPFFDWGDTGSQFTTYHLQITVAADIFFLFPANFENIGSSEFQTNHLLASNSAFIWRVRAKDGSGYGLFSLPFLFFTGTHK